MHSLCQLTSCPLIATAYLLYHPQSLVNTINLSEQQLVQCCNSATGCQISSGCDGGDSAEVRRRWTLGCIHVQSFLLYPSQAINYIGRLGQNTESRYPYTSASGTTGKCQSTLLSFPSGSGVQISGSAKLVSPQNDEIALMRAVATAPTTVYFDVEQSFMQ